MNLFDVLGPVMVGPSSSHTAGAVRIGFVVRRLLGKEPEKITMQLHGSFADTGKGHGTDQALVAGLLGMEPDDMRIPESFRIAEGKGIAVTVENVNIRGAHPNTVRLKTEAGGVKLETVASSLGGGRIQICQIDGIDTGFSGESPTLIVNNYDQPGCVAEVTSLLADNGVNIATMQLYRSARGGNAVMVVETDQTLAAGCLDRLRELPGVYKVTFLDMAGSSSGPAEDEPIPKGIGAANAETAGKSCKGAGASGSADNDEASFSLGINEGRGDGSAVNEDRKNKREGRNK